MHPLDTQDPLAHFRERFVIEDDTVYLDGNSLGRPPRETRELIRATVDEEWGKRLVRAWGEGWIDLPCTIGDEIGQLIGANPGEVIVSDSTSVNFFKLVMAALRARPGRKKIVTEASNFPSDLYVLQGCVDLLDKGHEIVSVSSPDGVHLSPELIEQELTEECALLTLSHTAFKSGYVHDMRRLTEAAHQVGALVIWDLSHSVGAVPVDLGACGVDFAVGCTYKYLNGGPGAPAFLYASPAMQETAVNPIWGWFGQRDAFDFGSHYDPTPGIGRFAVGTPPILSLAATRPGIGLVREAGLPAIRAKSVAQTEFLVALWREHLEPLGVAMNSPSDSRLRGSHVSLGHPEAYRIDQALIENHGVVPDFRVPDNLRLGISPLYTSFGEIERGVLAIREILETREFLRFSDHRSGVT